MTVNVLVASWGYCHGRELTVSVLIRLPIAGGVVLYDCPVHAVAQLLVHVDCNLVRYSYKEINKESTLSLITNKQKKARKMLECEEL